MERREHEKDKIKELPKIQKGSTQYRRVEYKKILKNCEEDENCC